MSQKEVESLTDLKTQGKEVNFMDITDTIDLEKGLLPKLSPIITELREEKYVKSLFTKISEANLNQTVISLSNFFNRFYTSTTGEESARWLYGEYQKVIQSVPIPRRNLLSVQLFTHPFRQPSIIASIKGKVTSTVAEEIVIVGGHIDSTAGGQNNRSPGADDDASGSATVFEVFRILATQEDFNPDRTVEFHGYAAEEVGLVGSQAVAQKYKTDQKRVHAMLQMDMTGFNPPQNSNRVGIITDFTNSEVNQILRRCVVTYGELPFGDTLCGYACSDHASWNRAGYRSSFGFEVGTFNLINRNIHTINDVITILDMKRAARYVKFSVGFAIELSKK